MTQPAIDLGVTLDDKYTKRDGRLFLTGIQALVRLPMMQRQRDAAAGLNTAGFISGYRGSPLGGLDTQLWAAGDLLKEHHITFKPGLNEDLAATAVWGSQQVGLRPGARYVGVFGLWYGKAPGVDRSGDAFRHANAAGTSLHGGVLALAGDDHTCKSSTLPSQSEFAFMDLEIPILNPSTIEEVLEYGLYGIALSRYAGTWVSMICHADTMDSSAAIELPHDFASVRLPTDFKMPPGGLSIRAPDQPKMQEQRLRNFKIPAVRAFLRANGLNKTTLDNPNGRLGIITIGKAHTATRQALEDLGLTDEIARSLGLKIFKLAMPWPIEMSGIQDFARGLEEVFVIEEKRPLIETQIKEALYPLANHERPRVIGKDDEMGRPLLRNTLDLPASQIARALAKRIPEHQWPDKMKAHLALIQEKVIHIGSVKIHHERKPYYCSGCPHNTSTQVPEGSRALAGIGCHYMATFMPERKADTFTQMGGEGVPWIGQAPFTDEPHVFANLGDGTYFHSGILAVRAAVSAGINITYKILFNDAVAMTGGQHVDGTLTVPQLTEQLAAEGVGTIFVVSDDIDKWQGQPGFAAGVKFEHRDHLDALQRDLRERSGVSVIVYDQTCAAEKRRRRKRGLMADPARRIFINERVCEGCGDCSKQSSCLSVEPLETEFGRKRMIDQSSCNKDYSCVKGFCPSFVSVTGGRVRAARAKDGTGLFAALPEPKIPSVGHEPYAIQITGIGGTGITSLTAILAMAAHLEGKAVRTLDMTGLSQKGGAVFSHIRIAAGGETVHGPRLGVAKADLVLACDMVTGAHSDVLDTTNVRRTIAVVNSDMTPTAEFITNGAVSYHTHDMLAEIERAVKGMVLIDASRAARKLLGDTIYANMLQMGFAYQKGLVPVSAAAFLRAIELNGASVKANKEAFAWGRLMAEKPEAVEPLLKEARTVSASLDEMIARRIKDLTAYQNAAYAARYKALVDAARAAESRLGGTDLTEAVARNFYKLMAYKDEYEVARLYTDGEFHRQIKETFEGGFKLSFHLAPPLVSKTDPATGRPPKATFGPWMMIGFRVLAQLKPLRGTWADPFGRSEERRLERQLIKDYETVMRGLLSLLTRETRAQAIAIANIPDMIRGYGPVKLESLKRAKAEEARLLAGSMRAPTLQAAE